MPPSVQRHDENALLDDRSLGATVRVLLILIAIGIVSVFIIAVYLNPYRGGRVWYSETHRQLGLPPCNFKRATGKPCPSCGMSSSFALFVRGDVVNSLEANPVGTLLAAFLAIFVPWSLLAAFTGKVYGVRSLEWILVRAVVIFFLLMFLRWAVLLVFSD